MLPRYDNKIELNYKNKKEIVKINYKMSKKETNTINLLKTEVLKNFSKNFKLENTNIKIFFQNKIPVINLNKNDELHIKRITQEAFINVKKHIATT